MKTPLKKTFSLVSLFVFSATVSFSLVSGAFASHAITSIMLFLDDGAPITTEQSIRVSLWSDGRLADGDITGAGAINVTAPNYAGYDIVLTRTPDSSGRTRIEFAYLTDLPYLTEENQFMMIEYKDSADPDTAYVIYDDTYVGSSMDRFPLINNGPQIFQEIYTNEATTANTFTYDHDDTGGDVTLTFGKTLNETFRWDNAQTSFSLSDDLIISGALDTAGITSTGVVDFSGASQVRIRESDFVVVPDCADVGELVFDTTSNQLKYCTGTGSPGAWSAVGSSSQDLDDTYNNDPDKVLDVDHASGLTINATTSGNILFNLQSTGDFVIQDNGTTFALFTNAGLFELSGLENTERIRLTDATNADSVGLYVGTGTPDGVISAQSGSVYFDELGALYINNSLGSGAIWNKTSLDKAQTVTVAKSGGDFTSVKAAVESITDASTTKRYVVNIYPGQYTEDAFTIPDFVSIQGMGNFENVKIIANVPTDTLVISGDESIVRNVHLSGASGVGGICYSTAKPSTFLLDVEFSDCETGILVTGAGTRLAANNLFVQVGDFTDAVRVQAGAIANIRNFQVPSSGTIAKAFNITGVGTRAQISSAVIISPTVADAVYVDSGALATILSINIQDTTNGIHVGPTGSSTIRGSGGIIEDMTNSTFLVESAAARVYFDAVTTQKEKFDVDPDALFSIVFNNNTPGEEGSNVFGRFSVGTPESSEDSYFGEGDPYTNGMLVYTFDGVTYTDVSAAAADTTSTFTFPGVATNNAIYVSSSRHHDDGDFVRFEGINYTTASTAASLGAGEIVEEFWNGSSWVVFPKLCFHRTLLYRYDDHCFDRPDSDEVNLFDNNVPLTWVKNDPVTLGTDQYWIRIRISSTILTAPVFQQFKIQPNSTNITRNGSTIFLGDSRVTNNIISSPDQIFFASGSNAPSNSSFNVGTGNPFSEDRVRSSFRGSGVNLDEMTGSVILPKGLDTSTTLNARVHWKKADNAAGNVQWHIDYAVIGPKNVPIVDGSNVVTAPRTTGEDLSTVVVNTISTAVEGGTNSNETFESVFTPGIDVSGHYQGDKLLLRLYRDAADPDDTYTGDAVITGFELNGAFWSLGEAH